MRTLAALSLVIALAVSATNAAAPPQPPAKQDALDGLRRTMEARPEAGREREALRRLEEALEKVRERSRQRGLPPQFLGNAGRGLSSTSVVHNTFALQHFGAVS